MAATDTMPVSQGVRSRAERGRAMISYVVLIIGSISFLVPFFWMLTTSLKDDAQIYTFPVQWIPRPAMWENYARLFEQAPMWTYLRNTVILTVCVLLSMNMSSVGAGTVTVPTVSPALMVMLEPLSSFSVTSVPALLLKVAV